MSNEMEDILLIRKLLNEDLTKAEKEELYSRAASDAEFKKLIEKEYHLFIAINRVKRKESLSRLFFLEKSIRNEENGYKTKHFSLRKKGNILVVAASIAVIIAFSVWGYLQLTSSVDEAYLVQLNETKFKPGWTFRSPEERGHTSFQSQFRKNYNEEDYTEAVKAYENIPNHLHSQIDSIAFGYSLLKIGQSEQARSIFNQINSFNNIYTERLEWYIALCLIDTKQFEAAKKLLDEIMNNPEHDFQRNAIEIMKTLS